MSDRDTLERSDPALRLAAGLNLHAKQEADNVAESLDKARKRLVALATHASQKGDGVSVRLWKAGNLEYKRVPELCGVELNRYRGQGREVRVTAVK